MMIGFVTLLAYVVVLTLWLLRLEIGHRTASDRFRAGYRELSKRVDLLEDLAQDPTRRAHIDRWEPVEGKDAIRIARKVRNELLSYAKYKPKGTAGENYVLTRSDVQSTEAGRAAFSEVAKRNQAELDKMMAGLAPVDGEGPTRA